MLVFVHPFLFNAPCGPKLASKSVLFAEIETIQSRERMERQNSTSASSNVAMWNHCYIVGHLHLDLVKLILPSIVVTCLGSSLLVSFFGPGFAPLLFGGGRRRDAASCADNIAPSCSAELALEPLVFVSPAPLGIFAGFALCCFCFGCCRCWLIACGCTLPLQQFGAKIISRIIIIFIRLSS